MGHNHRCGSRESNPRPTTSVVFMWGVVVCGGKSCLGGWGGEWRFQAAKLHTHQNFASALSRELCRETHVVGERPHAAGETLRVRAEAALGVPGLRHPAVSEAEILEPRPLR